jgi:hypothetical protein
MWSVSQAAKPEPDDANPDIASVQNNGTAREIAR